MLGKLQSNSFVTPTSLSFLLVCLVTIQAQTPPTQPLQIRSEKELRLALVKAQTNRPADVPTLLKDNSRLLSESFWKEILDEATQRYSENQHDRAFMFYAIAVQVAAELNNEKLLAKTYYYLGRSYSGLSQFEKAKEAYLESEKAFVKAGLQRDLIYILSDLGTLNFILEDYAAARSYSEQSVGLASSLKTSSLPPGIWPDEFGVAGALSTLGELASREGDISQALDYLKRSLSLFQQLNDANSSYDYYLGDVYASLGRAYISAGDHVQGLAALNKALDISRDSKNQQQQASRLNDIGFLYMEQEDYAQATAKFEESLSKYRLLKNRREEARVLLNLGVVEQREAKYDEALSTFETSLAAARATKSVDVEIAAREGIGVASAGKKNYATALQALDESLSLARSINDRTRQAELVWRAAQVKYEMADFARSAELAQIALSTARELHWPKLVYLATTTLGEAFSALNKIDLATETLKDAVEEIEAMRDQVGGQEEARQLFFEDKVSSYDSLIELLIRQGKGLEALQYAERSKGRVLVDALKSSRADLAKYMTASEREEKLRLNARVSEIGNRIRKEATTGSALDSLYKQLDAARLDYQSFQDSLYVAHPDLRMRVGQIAPLTAEDINYLTPSNCAYLEYVVNEKNVHLFILAKRSTRTGFELKVVTLPVSSEDLAKKIDLFHQRLADRHPEFVVLARELYAALIDPISEQLHGINTVCVIPDTFLWNLPFQALMTRRNQYLIEDYALSYMTSLSILREMTRERVGAGTRGASLIAFGNPKIGREEQRSEELCPLPEAEREVRTIAQRFDSGSKVLIGPDASEKVSKPWHRTTRRFIWQRMVC
jgi:tetratricopeptide (TPR) repeat protein